MILDEIVSQLLSITLIVAFAFSGTFFCIFLERFLGARIQHRDGPGVGGKIDYLQVWKDFQKIRTKGNSPASVKIRLLFFGWMALPVIFLVLLLSRSLPSGFSEAGLWLLCSFLLVSVSVEAILLRFSTSGKERLDWRGPILLKVLGVSALVLSSIALAMRAGSADLAALSSFQGEFPYYAIFFSPGLFILSLISFVSIYIVVGDSPIYGNDEKGLGGTLQYGIFFNKRMWSFSLICFWTFLFIGGFDGVLAKMFFPLKGALFLLGYVLLKISVPYVRSSDAGALTLRWLLTFGFVGFALEVLWVGFQG